MFLLYDAYNSPLEKKKIVFTILLQMMIEDYNS